MYWVALPCLLFREFARTKDYSGGGQTLLLVLAGMIACIAVGYLAAVILRLPGAKVGTFVQGSFRANLAYVGLAVISYAFEGPQRDEAFKLGVIVLAGTAPVYNVIAVVVLLASRHRLGLAAARKLAVSIVTNPIIIACAAGAGFSLLAGPLGIRLPIVADKALGMVGQSALPLALFCIGGALAATSIRGRAAPSLAAAIIKTSVGPAIGALVAMWMNIGAMETRVALILLACPTAVASYVLSEQLDGDGPLAAGIIVTSTVLSLAALTLVLSVTGC